MRGGGGDAESLLCGSGFCSEDRELASTISTSCDIGGVKTKERSVIRASECRRLSAIPVGVSSVIVALFAVALMVPGQAATNLTLVSLDIGNVVSENAVLVVPAEDSGWSPVQPDMSGGDWGGYAASSKDTRTVWFLDDDPWAELYFHFVGSARTIQFDALDGYANDSFTLSVKGDAGWVVVFEYVDMAPAEDVNEAWTTHCVDLTPFMCTGVINFGGGEFALRFESTGAAWDYFDDYGQCAFDYLYIYGNGKA